MVVGKLICNEVNMKKIFIYKTKAGKFYFESEDTYKHSNKKEVLFEIETDYPEPLKKTEIQQEIKNIEDVDKLLIEIFGE